MKDYLVHDDFRRIRLITGCTQVQCANYLERKYKVDMDKDEEDANMGGFSIQDEKGNCYIWVDKSVKKEELIFTVVHEVLHSLFDIFKYINGNCYYNTTRLTQEVFLYLMKSISKKIMNKLNIKV